MHAWVPAISLSPAGMAVQSQAAATLAAVGFDLWQLEVTNQTSVDELIKKVKEKYGRIDFLFLNAGAFRRGMPHATPWLPPCPLQLPAHHTTPASMNHQPCLRQLYACPPQQRCLHESRDSAPQPCTAGRAYGEEIFPPASNQSEFYACKKLEQLQASSMWGSCWSAAGPGQAPVARLPAACFR